MTPDTIEGFIYAMVGSLFGVFIYLTIKRVNAGDGVFFCFCMSAGIMLVGILIDFTLANDNGYYSKISFHRPPKFEAIAMWSGAVWLVGTLMCPKIVRAVGMGVGVGIWATMDLLTAWASSKFGLFGLEVEPVASPLLNYTGVALACASMVAFMLVKQGSAEASAVKNADVAVEASAVNNADEAIAVNNADGASVVNNAAAGGICESAAAEQADGEPTQQDSGDEVCYVRTVSTADGLSVSATVSSHDTTTSCSTSSSKDYDLESQLPSELVEEASKHGKACTAQAEVALAEQGRSAALLQHVRRHATGYLGVLGAMFSGFLQGLKLDSSQYLVELGQKGQDHSACWIDYMCPLFTGIFITATIALAVYVLNKGKQRYMPREIILPGVFAGVLWALATLCTFWGSAKLGAVVTYPLMATIIAILTTALAAYYGEFLTRRCCVLAIVGTFIRILAVTLIALSSTPGANATFAM